MNEERLGHPWRIHHVAHRSLCYCLCSCELHCAHESPVFAEGQTRYKVAYATYLGGSQWDQAREVIILPDQSVLIGAHTSSDDMPTSVDAVQPTYAGDDPSLGHGGIYGGDCYLAHLSSDGSQLLYCTYLGGSGDDMVRSLAIASDGVVYLVGNTSSPDFPATTDALQTKFGGGKADAYVIKLVPP